MAMDVDTVTDVTDASTTTTMSTTYVQQQRQQQYVQQQQYVNNNMSTTTICQQQYVLKCFKINIIIIINEMHYLAIFFLFFLTG